MDVSLPIPSLDAHHFGARLLSVLTDDALYAACGVRIAFTGRAGGVSEGDFASLNLGSRVGDRPEDVSRNRSRVLEALGADDVLLVSPKQVHGTRVLGFRAQDAHDTRSFKERFADLCAAVEEGCDGIAIDGEGVAPLLSFADCVPLIVVSPSGRFVVAHAGWRGAVAGMPAYAVQALEVLDGVRTVKAADAKSVHAASTLTSAYNAYLGPHIHAECFSVGADVAHQFKERFGALCLEEPSQVNLAKAVSINLQEAGLRPERICDAGICTVCNSDDYFSYRASKGHCGRHAALAFRMGRPYKARTR